MGQTTETSIPDPTGQEKELLDLFSQVLMPTYLKEQGYNVETKKVTWEDSDEYKSLMKQRAAAAKLPKVAPLPSYRQPLNYVPPVDPVAAIDAKIAEAKDKFKEYTDYDVSEKMNPEEQYAYDKYGKDSKEFKAAKAKAAEAKVADFKQQQEIQKTFQEKTMKFLKGDYTLTPEEQKNLEESTKSVSASLENIFKGTLEETEKAFGDFTKIAGENGMTIRDTLGAVGAQIESTGIEMSKALDNVVKTRSELMKQGIVDATGEITKKVSMNAANSGRDPSDPEFQADMKQIIAKEVNQGQLELADMESRARMGIAERTGSGLENVAQQQAAQRLEIAKKKGIALASLDSRVAGTIPNQLAVGQGGSQYMEALAQQRLANAQGAMGAAMGGAEYWQQDRHANTTTTQSNDPFSTILSAGLGAASAGAKIYGASQMGGLMSGMTPPVASKGSGVFNPMMPSLGGR